jgi:hypothetical protein
MEGDEYVHRYHASRRFSDSSHTLGGVRNHYFSAPGHPAAAADPHFFPGDMERL